MSADTKDLAERLRLPPDEKTKGAMQRDGLAAADELERLTTENETGWAEVERLARERDRLTTELAALRERLGAAELGAKRYETLRRFNAQQFTDAFVLNRRTGKPFDEIVDDMRPFMFPAMSASTKEPKHDAPIPAPVAWPTTPKDSE